jgi:DtxR family Mn-dependent transcriptional regulator
MSDSHLTESQLHYLLTIYELSEEKGVARSREIAESLGVSRPSVTGAVQTLAQRGYVYYEPYGHVRLTKEGAQEARQVLLRHRAAYDFFVSVLGLSEDRADEIAGDLEKRLPGDLLCRLVQFNDYYKKRSEVPFSWQPHCSGLCTALYGEGPDERCHREGAEYHYQEAAQPG